VPYLTQARDGSHSPLQFPTGAFDFGTPYGLRRGKSSTHSET